MDNKIKAGDIVYVVNTEGGAGIQDFFAEHPSGTFTVKSIDLEGRVHLVEDTRGRFCFFPSRFKKQENAVLEVTETDLEELLNG